MKARLFITIIIMLASLYLIYAMADAGKINAGRETGKIKEVIDKALVQCYALEGSYPPDVEYLKNYGVILDEEKYFYDYDMFATNIKPSVTVILK